MGSESVLWIPERNEEETGWVRTKDKEVSNTSSLSSDHVSVFGMPFPFQFVLLPKTGGICLL